MFTPDERRALLFLALMAAVGGAMRLVRAAPGPPGAGVAPHLAGDDVARQAALSRRAGELARPLAPGEKVDLDRAGVAEVERLPRVGPQLARRIVAERESGGVFGSLAALDARVTGVGAAMVRDLEPWVEFSGMARATVGQGGLGYPSAARGPCPSVLLLDPNRATTEELTCLPGIGPTLAARLVADRDRRGAFSQVTDLERVPGIGAERVRRLTPHLTLP